MSIYRFQEGSIVPPDGWRNQSITSFRLTGSGDPKKDAAILITRDDDALHDDLHEYVGRQQRALEKQFPGFTLLGHASFTLDGVPAVLLDYWWRGTHAPMRQSQAIAHVGTTMLIFTLTAHIEHFERYTTTWTALLSSFRCSGRSRDPSGSEADDPSSPQHAITGYVFALHRPTQTLSVLATRADALAFAPAHEIAAGQWTFFDHTGRRLESWLLTAGVHTLQPGDPIAGALSGYLSSVRLGIGLAPFDSIRSIEEWLARPENRRSHA